MKKIIFSSLFILTTLFSNAQSPYISIDHLIQTHYIGAVSPANLYTHDFANEVIETTPSSASEMVIELFVENLTGDSVHWTLSRTRIGVDTSWNDYLCWGPSTDEFGGQCISIQQMDTNIWDGLCTEIFVADLGDGDSAVISAHLYPNTNESGCGTYRYYVGTCQQPHLDSVDISVCFSVGLDELNDQEISLIVAPNPANNIISITANSDESMNFEIYNSLGQIVESGSFTNTEFIDASKLENGIYFVTVHGEGNLSKTEKIIISH